jgi:hypothetical protein
MPQTPHIERHFTSSDVVRDIVIGMSDGLTVPRFRENSRVFICGDQDYFSFVIFHLSVSIFKNVFAPGVADCSKNEN